MATAAKSMEIDPTGAALSRAFATDTTIEASAYRHFLQAERNLVVARQRRRASENAYLTHCAGRVA